jgi:hypothetical protein
MFVMRTSLFTRSELRAAAVMARGPV